MTPVGSGAARPSLGLILPATTQGELRSECSNTLGTTNGARRAGRAVPPGRGHRGRLPLGGGPSLLAPPHRRGAHHAGRGRRGDHPADPGDLRAPAAPAPAGRRGQAGDGPPAPLGRPLRPRPGRRQPRGGVRAGRRRLPPPGTPHGRGRRRPAGGLGARRDRTPTTSRSRRLPPSPCGSAGRAPRPGAGPRPWATAGSPCSSRRTSTRLRWPRSRRETAEAGRDPGAVEPGVVVFACVGDDDAAARGAAWLSELYRLPAKAFRRHLVAGSPGRVRRRAAALRRGRRAPHRRHGGRFARRGALRPAPRRLRPATRSGSSTGAPA